jgi:hypothetical protein
LETLHVEGQQKDIDVIACLLQLQDLTLRSITVPSLEFLQQLPKLWSIDIKLGGTKNLTALAALVKAKYLELWQVRGLSDLSPISQMAGLQYLYLQSLRNVTRLPDLSGLVSLRRLYLENMKGLKDVSSIESAPALEELIHVSAHGLEPSDYANLVRAKRLKRALFGFGSDRKNQALLEVMRENGIEEYRHKPFQFT